MKRSDLKMKCTLPETRQQKVGKTECKVQTCWACLSRRPQVRPGWCTCTQRCCAAVGAVIRKTKGLHGKQPTVALRSFHEHKLTFVVLVSKWNSHRWVWLGVVTLLTTAFSSVMLHYGGKVRSIVSRVWTEQAVTKNLPTEQDYQAGRAHCLTPRQSTIHKWQWKFWKMDQTADFTTLKSFIVACTGVSFRFT